MAKATVHPDHRLISSEDVQGTSVYGVGEEAIGEIDHLLIEKVSGRVSYAVMSFGGFLGLGHSHYPTTPISVAIAPASRKINCGMPPNLATTPLRTATGSSARTSITAPRPTGPAVAGRPRRQ